MYLTARVILIKYDTQSTRDVYYDDNIEIDKLAKIASVHLHINFSGLKIRLRNGQLLMF